MVSRPEVGARETTQPSLRRMRDFGIRPKRDLGQNFLIDSNILGVIEREAQLGPEDVVLEIGGGLGVLSEYLAPRVAHVHVVELDRALEPALRDAIDPFDNVTLHFADAMKLDLRALDPAPTKVVANLPYGIAAGAILRTIEELDGATRWVGMVQKEVGERFAAGPGSSAYGLPSVLAQLACAVAGAAARRAHGVLAGAERRLRARRPDAHRPGPGARSARAGRGGVRAPPQGARRLAGARARRPARRPHARPDGARRARPPARRARRAPLAAGLSRSAR